MPLWHVHVHDRGTDQPGRGDAPDRHLKLDQNMVCIPAAKGHDDRWITVPRSWSGNWHRCLDFIREGSIERRTICASSVLQIDQALERVGPRPANWLASICCHFMPPGAMASVRK
jgi:hypothetical protein